MKTSHPAKSKQWRACPHDRGPVGSRPIRFLRSGYRVCRRLRPSGEIADDIRIHTRWRTRGARHRVPHLRPHLAGEVLVSAINEGRKPAAARKLCFSAPAERSSRLRLTLSRRSPCQSPGGKWAIVDDWEAVARDLAWQFELRVEVSMPRGDLHVRFSRYAQDGHNGR